jgi:integrase
MEAAPDDRGVHRAALERAARRVLRVRQRLDRWNTPSPPKSAAGRRDVPLSSELVAVLREWKLACPPGEMGLAFPNSVGQPDTHSNIDGRFWRPLQRRTLGEVRYGFHGLRISRSRR